jgi:hypothetical protein
VRSGQWLVAESRSKLPSTVNSWEICHTARRGLTVLFGQAADVYARMIQCKARLSAVNITTAGATPAEGASKIGNVGLEAVWQKNSS